MKALITVYHPQLKRLIFNDAAISRLNALCEVTWAKEGVKFNEESLKECIHEYDICITSWGSPKLTRQVLDKAERLKFLGHAAGTIVPYIDEYLYDKGITVVNANSCLAHSTAEAALALMMTLSWKLTEYTRGMKQGIWSKNFEETVPGISHQNIGLVGYGDISKVLITLLKPFNPNILLFSQHCTPKEAEAMGVQLCSLNELLSKSRIISLHNTLNHSTMGMIGKKELNLIQDGALLVNTARGPIIEEAALLETLKTGRIFAALDVYHQEPIPSNHELLALPNVICTPHIGGFCQYWKTRLGECIVNELERWLQAKPLYHDITKQKLSTMTPL